MQMSFQAMNFSVLSVTSRLSGALTYAPYACDIFTVIVAWIILFTAVSMLIFCHLGTTSSRSCTVVLVSFDSRLVQWIFLEQHFVFSLVTINSTRMVLRSPSTALLISSFSCLPHTKWKIQSFSYLLNRYVNLFYGEVRHETLGSMTFKDEKNG